MKAIYIDWNILNEMLNTEHGCWTHWVAMMDENGKDIGKFRWTSDFSKDEDKPSFLFKLFFDGMEDPLELDRCRLEDFACGGAIFFQKAPRGVYERPKPVLAVLPFVDVNNLP